MRRAIVYGVTTAFVVAVALVYFALQRPFVLSGDPNSAYFPTVVGLWSGHGLASFASLSDSGFRMPLYPVALAIAAAFTTDLMRAGQLLGIASAFFVVAGVVAAAYRMGARPLAAIAAGIVVAAHPNFVRSALEPLPDMFYLAFFVAAVLLSIANLEPSDELTSRRLIAAAGAAASLGFMVRVNALALAASVMFGLLWLAPGTLRERGRAAALYLVTAFIVVIPWIALVIHLRPGISYPMINLSASNSISEAGNVSKGAAMAHALWLGIKDQPARISGVMPWWLALGGLIALANEARTSKAARMIVLIGIAMQGLLLPMHFEARYYLFLPVLLVPVLAVACSRWRAPHASYVFVAVALVSAVSDGLSTAKDVKREADIGRQLVAMCDEATCAAREAKIDRPWLLGVGWGHGFSSLRFCPGPTRPIRSLPNQKLLLLVGSRPTWAGLDGWYSRPEEAAPIGMRLLADVGGHRFYQVPPVNTSTSSGDESIAVPIAIDFQLPYFTSCTEAAIQLPAGRTARASIEVSENIAAVFLLSQGDREAGTWTSATADVTIDLAGFAPGPTTARLCVHDALDAGRARVTKLLVKP